MKLFLTHWKTTVNGILAFLITTLTILSGFFGTEDLTAGHAGLSSVQVHTWIPTAVALLLALCRAWVGLLQQDPGTTIAVVPGAQSPVAVPSHEMPDDPAAKPVIKENQ